MLVQLSGVPGSGKSTLARDIAEATGLVVLDTDVLKTALLEGGIPVTSAGRPTFAAALALAADLLAQGRSVVLDSPCRYPQLLAAGQRLATGRRGPACLHRAVGLGHVGTAPPARPPTPAGVPGRIVDGSRPRHRLGLGTPEDTLRAWQSQLVRPEEDWLRLDAHAEAPTNLSTALAYLT